MISFKHFLELTEDQNVGKIAGSGVNAERHKQKYIDPHINSGQFTHVLHTSHSRLEAGSRVQLHGFEWKNDPKRGKVLHVHASDEHGNHYLIPASKLQKPNDGHKTENRGHQFENSFIEHLKKHGLMDKDAQGAGSTAGTDFHVINKKQNKKHAGKVQANGATELNGETKQDHTAAMGQLTIHHTKERGWHISDEARAKRPEYAKHVEEHVIPHMNKYHPDPSKQRRTESGRAESVRIHHPDMEPAKAYLRDHHVDILHVGGGKGTYAVGKDKTGHGLPQISGKGIWTVREKARSSGKNGVTARTVMFQPHGKHGLTPSHVNLENEDHVKAFKRTLGHSD